VAKRCIRLTPVEAELGKLITNMSRYVSFAMANEFYMICDSYGANSHAVIAACNEDYKRLDFPRPGPNVGGPCLYKDGYYLTERIQYPEIIASSFRINESVPRYLLDKVVAITRLRRVGVLGLAFKADCDDTRNSLSYKLIKQIRGLHAEPVAVDPYVPELADMDRLAGVDALFLMTPHSEFKDLDHLLSIVDNPDCIVVDMWNFWPITAEMSPDGVFRAGNTNGALA
jgi:UDP-N-acetyl-D-mannosaminuronic acid dehydrogenase